jgi:hypothetical protein
MAEAGADGQSPTAAGLLMVACAADAGTVTTDVDGSSASRDASTSGLKEASDPVASSDAGQTAPVAAQSVHAMQDNGAADLAGDAVAQHAGDTASRYRPQMLYSQPG